MYVAYIDQPCNEFGDSCTLHHYYSASYQKALAVSAPKTKPAVASPKKSSYKYMNRGRFAKQARLSQANIDAVVNEEEHVQSIVAAIVRKYPWLKPFATLTFDFALRITSGGATINAVPDDIMLKYKAEKKKNQITGSKRLTLAAELDLDDELEDFDDSVHEPPAKKQRIDPSMLLSAEEIAQIKEEAKKAAKAQLRKQYLEQYKLQYATQGLK